MRDPMFPSEQFKQPIVGRRIQGWDELGQPVGGLKDFDKPERITSLAAHYGALADSVATEEFKKAQDEVEKEFEANAKKGKRQFNWYPSSLGKKYKDMLTKWMQDDGVVVNWKHDQRDGDWVEIIY